MSRTDHFPRHQQLNVRSYAALDPVLRRRSGFVQLIGVKRSVSTVSEKTTITDTIYTTTTTVTMVASTPTLYAACAANNVIGTSNGHGIYGYYYANSEDRNSNVNTGPVACCVTCQTTANCVIYAQYPGGPCYYLTLKSGQCDGSKTNGDQILSDYSISPNSGYMVGNGNCGQVGQN